MVMGNKMDIEEDRKVSREQAEGWSDANGILYMETSARSGLQVESAFNKIAHKILEDKVERLNEKKAKREGKNENEKVKETPTPNDTPTPVEKKMKLGQRIRDKIPSQSCNQC